VIVTTAVSSHAGFWSSLAGGVAANTITNSSGSSKKGLDQGQTDEMKMQQALYGLGYYDGKLDGNLNTMDSRLAIQKFQKDNNIKENGILKEENRQHLLYAHELYELILSSKTSKEKRYQAYDEIDKMKSLMGGGK
jgi:peptidoglycan hydrolase-like protein with peptidoglycan-binding domain